MSKLSFNRRPMPIYAEHRPLYKVAQILMALDMASRGGKSSLLKLQLFNWALKEGSRQKLIEDAVKTGRLKISVWGIDPTLNAAIQFAIAERLITQEASSLVITKKGKEYIDAIIKDNALPEEYAFYSSIKKKITEGMISAVADTWG